ncbi:hypothetical protein ACOI3P_20850, partial [Acinetobacter baumannii]
NNYYDIISMSYLFLSCTETIPTRIVQEPLSGIEDKSVSSGGGGSIGAGFILSLLGLVALRRFKS